MACSHRTNILVGTCPNQRWIIHMTQPGICLGRRSRNADEFPPSFLRTRQIQLADPKDCFQTGRNVFSCVNICLWFVRFWHWLVILFPVEKWITSWFCPPSRAQCYNLSTHVYMGLGSNIKHLYLEGNGKRWKEEIYQPLEWWIQSPRSESFSVCKFGSWIHKHKNSQPETEPWKNFFSDILNPFPNFWKELLL